MLRAVHSLVEQQNMTEDMLLQLTRVIGQALAKIAEAQISATAERLFSHDATDSLGVPPAALNNLTALVPQIEAFLRYALRRHLLAATLRWIPVSDAPETAAKNVTVGFADLVGFTALTQQIETAELAAMVNRFEKLAYDHITSRGGRIVKMIGDEVMFVVEDPVVAMDTALSLVEAFAADAKLPDVRVGLAHGPALSFEGDLFGPTVNLASRLVTLAHAGTVLLSDELGTHIEGNPLFELRHLRAIRLKGIGHMRVWVLRRSPPPSL
jgi:adenylate cyclase